LGAGPSGSASGHRAHRRLRAEQGRTATGALERSRPKSRPATCSAARHCGAWIVSRAAIAAAEAERAKTTAPVPACGGRRYRSAHQKRFSRPRATLVVPGPQLRVHGAAYPLYGRAPTRRQARLGGGDRLSPPGRTARGWRQATLVGPPASCIYRELLNEASPVTF
jgi:hypothetical protein